jgi:hypothetical protein
MAHAHSASGRPCAAVASNKSKAASLRSQECSKARKALGDDEGDFSELTNQISLVDLTAGNFCEECFARHSLSGQNDETVLRYDCLFAVAHQSIEASNLDERIRGSTTARCPLFFRCSDSLSLEAKRVCFMR